MERMQSINGNFIVPEKAIFEDILKPMVSGTPMFL